MGEVFNSLVDRRSDLRALSRLFRIGHAALAPGGVLLFDALVRERSRRAAREIVREGKDWAVMGKDWAVIVWTALERGGSRLVRRVTTFRRGGRGTTWRRGTETISTAIFDARARERAGVRARSARSSNFADTVRSFDEPLVLAESSRSARREPPGRTGPASPS